MKTKVLLAAIVVSPLLQSLHPASAQTKQTAKTQGVVAVFSLDGPITEKPKQDDLQLLLGSQIRGLRGGV